jgi:hypothetical protein
MPNGAAQESNLPSVGLRRRTGFEDQLGHRPRPLRGGAYLRLQEPQMRFRGAFPRGVRPVSEERRS